MRKTRTITLWLVSAALAVLFTVAGIAKFADAGVREQFSHWGYPDWFRALVGVLEIGGGLALLLPGLAWRGALILGVVMLGAVCMLWWHDETVHAMAPASVLLLVSITGYAHHPRASFMRRLRSAVDRVAEREMEEQRKRIALHEAMKALKRPKGRKKRCRKNPAEEISPS
jgi:putative oxidoreductase